MGCEPRVSRDFVQVPELVGFRLLLSHPAGDPLNYGLLFINFPDTIFIFIFILASSGYLAISNCLKIEGGTGDAEIEEMKK